MGLRTSGVEGKKKCPHVILEPVKLSFKNEKVVLLAMLTPTIVVPVQVPAALR